MTNDNKEYQYTKELINTETGAMMRGVFKTSKEAEQWGKKILSDNEGFVDNGLSGQMGSQEYGIKEYFFNVNKYWDSMNPHAEWCRKYGSN